MVKPPKQFTEAALAELEKHVVATKVNDGFGTMSGALAQHMFQQLIDNARAYNALAESLASVLATTEDELGIVDVEELEKWIAGLSTHPGMPVIGADRIRKLIVLAKMAKLRVLRPRDWRQVAIDALLEASETADAKAKAVIDSELDAMDSVSINGLTVRTTLNEVMISIDIGGQEFQIARGITQRMADRRLTVAEIHEAITKRTPWHIRKPGPYDGIDRSVAPERLSGVTQQRPFDANTIREAVETVRAAEGRRSEPRDPKRDLLGLRPMGKRPVLCPACQVDPDPRGWSACFACREINAQ